MTASLTPSDALALFGAMVVLALVPSVSVLTVSARAAAGGFAQGAWTALGIVVADVLFILLALFGLALLVEWLEGGLAVVRYAGAAWLMWLGIRLWRSAHADVTPMRAVRSGSSFAAGLLVTLGDQKAILFYFGFLPVFLDLESVTPVDAAIVSVLAAAAVGSVKLGYAWMAAAARTPDRPQLAGTLNRLAAAVLVAAALLLLFGE